MQLLALVVGGTWILFLVWALGLQRLLHATPLAFLLPIRFHIIHVFTSVIGLGLSAGLFILARYRRIHGPHLIDVGRVYFVALALLVSITRVAGAVFLDSGNLDLISGTCILILLYPTLVPTPRARFCSPRSQRP